MAVAQKPMHFLFGGGRAGGGSGGRIIAAPFLVTECLGADQFGSGPTPRALDRHRDDGRDRSLRNSPKRPSDGLREGPRSKSQRAAPSGHGSADMLRPSVRCQIEWRGCVALVFVFVFLSFFGPSVHADCPRNSTFRTNQFGICVQTKWCGFRSSISETRLLTVYQATWTAYKTAGWSSP